ncbi:MAG TPA: uroporphyrinogen-III synthase [Oleiagrimonas sp.]|nr:uroporphyrinogen-III synthase [Oleiagrimonas sp.]
MPAASRQPLRGIDVLITRPVGQGRALACRVRALGGQPLLLPGVSLRAIESGEQVHEALECALAGDVVLFTSPAAVRFAARVLPLHGRARVAAVGAATARALRRHDVGDVIEPSGRQDSEGLLAHPALASVRGCAVAVIGAPGGRGVLQQRLRERGARVTEVAVYQRVPARLDRRHRQAVRGLRQRHVVLLSSVQTVQRLQRLLDAADWRHVVAGTAVVSSQRVADAARQAGFERVVRAASALTDALLTGAVQAAREL